MQSAIDDVLTGILKASTQELKESTAEDLEKYWFFTFDPVRSLEWNMYQFHDLLLLYSRKCRQWEEMHNGCCCVVERVRDKYLMPKITEFIADAQTFIPALATGEVHTIYKDDRWWFFVEVPKELFGKQVRVVSA